MSEQQDEDQDYPFPSLGFFAGHDLPDLAKIPRSQWRAALSPLSRMARDKALRLQPLEISVAAWDLAMELYDEDARRRTALRRAADGTDAVPVPPSGRGHRRARQVNARLYDRDFHRLQEAARLLGVKPSELARTFIVRGTARVLAEHERATAQP